MLGPTELYDLLPRGIRKPIGRVLKSYPLVRLYYAENSYLRTKGWVRSEQLGLPVDSDGNPLPWYTLPAIDFLKNRLQHNFRVFEYGSGYSSLWYAERVEEVLSVEDDTEWATHMQDRAPSNLNVIHQPDLNAYPKTVTDHGRFEIIVVDGCVRRECVKPALEAVANDGIIILDDFERWETDDWRALRDAGFRELPFVGPKAQRLTESNTAILYRDQNCLDI